jgi:uncharacterized protein (TIGR00375 family)
MQEYYADLHIHVGLSEAGKWIKIPTSKYLTLRNILDKAINRKGMNLIGIADALSPLVLADLEKLILEGSCVLDNCGGYCYQEKLNIILGAEIETVEENGGAAHTLIYLPDIETMKKFSTYMSKFIRNINLSSQNAHISLAKLVDIAASFEAIVVPAHVFTPYKGIYGSCTARLSHILSDKQLEKISGIELGLSADSFMADRIKELESFSFLTNSDAHSLDKIAREYNILLLEKGNFAEFRHALLRKNGRTIKVNYGLDPRLGKYHRNLCQTCGYVESKSPGVWKQCPICLSKKVVNGVYDRIEQIADYDRPNHPVHRAPYFYQIPLEFIPGIGKKVLEKLIEYFGTEMNVIHNAAKEDMQRLVGQAITDSILKARFGELAITAGGGGIYGKIQKNNR